MRSFLNFASERPPTIKITDDAILEIKKINIKTIKPIIYEIPDINLTIYYYACDNLNNKITISKIWYNKRRRFFIWKMTLVLN
jgi:hypothetical protein